MKKLEELKERKAKDDKIRREKSRSKSKPRIRSAQTAVTSAINNHGIRADKSPSNNLSNKLIQQNKSQVRRQNTTNNSNISNRANVANISNISNTGNNRSKSPVTTIEVNP